MQLRWDFPRVISERQGKSVIGLCQTNLSLSHGSRKSRMPNPGLLMRWLTWGKKIISSEDTSNEATGV